MGKAFGEAQPVKISACGGQLDAALESWGRFESGRDMLRAEREGFRADGELVRARFDRIELDLLTVDAARFAVSRTAGHVARTSDTRHIVVVQLAGSSILTPADGRAPVRLEPGTVSYGDPTVPYQWEFAEPFTLLMLRTPRAALPITPAALRPLLGNPFSAESGYGRLAVRHANDVLRDPSLLASPVASRIVQDVVGTFVTMLTEQLAATDQAEPTDPAFHRAVRYLEQHLIEPMPLHEIAAANDVSPRYLQTLFQRQGVSVTGWIRERRLERARQALADPTWATADIFQIAVAHGFSDHSHFTRAFRTAYGETPSHWRKRAA